MDISKRASASEIHQMLEEKLTEISSIFSGNNLEHLRDQQKLQANINNQQRTHELTNIAENGKR